LLGALLTTQAVNAITFLRLGQEWQYWLPGGLVLLAAAAFARSAIRRRAKATA
jgi:ribose/xylose/arabinose/galactoside ABC-type transport system permease subunit